MIAALMRVRAAIGCRYHQSVRLLPPQPDPSDGSGKLYAVELVPGSPLKQPVTLAEVKAVKHFADFALVRLPRLSVMPVSDEQWSWIAKRGGL